MNSLFRYLVFIFKLYDFTFRISWYIIQILTATVMKYHVSVGLPRELYFPKGLYFPEARSAEGKYNHEGKYNYLGTTDT